MAIILSDIPNTDFRIILGEGFKRHLGLKLFAVSNGLAIKIRAWSYNNLPSKPMLTRDAKFTVDTV